MELIEERLRAPIKADLRDDGSPGPLSRERLEAANVIAQMRAALTKIRAEAATTENGGAWAAGIAVLCLGTLPS